MRVLLLSAAVLWASGASFASAQSVDEAALKAVVQAQAKAWIERNTDAAQALWLHDDKATRAAVGIAGYSFQQGWEKISAATAKNNKENPNPLAFTPTMENFIVTRHDGNIALVEFDQKLAGPDVDFSGGSSSHEYRVLVKEGGQWKIASSITHNLDAFGNTPQAIENRLNASGYTLLQNGKTEDAIEVFKVNVHAYPQSWNVYDSLGEAYAAAGQKDLAIQNYQKSLELNPKNDTGRQALAKLKTP